MYFSFHILPDGHPDTSCYFRLHTGDWTVNSPLFPDRKAALVEMENLILRLRGATVSQLYRTTSEEQAVDLTFFGKQSGLLPSPAPVAELEAPADRLERIRAAATGNTYRIVFQELIGDELSPTLADLSAERLLNPSAWRETGSSLLHITRPGKASGILPKFGGQINPVIGPCTPLFNALQPFANTDIALFRGRKRECQEVRSLLLEQSVLLVYGPDRVGKTSLLQCGLANLIKDDDAHLLMIPCEGAAVFDSLDTVLRDRLTELGAEAPPAGEGSLALARRIAASTDVRQYLVFDQLEDILSAEVYDADRAALLGFVKELTTAEPDAFRVILSLREAFLAPLAEQEAHLPHLLNNRYRLLPLREKSMVNASVNFLDFLKADGKITGDDSRAVSEKVCHALADNNGNVPPHCLQVYLHQLHQHSCRETKEGPVPITLDLIDRLGPAQELIDSYYTEQLTALEPKRVEQDGVPDPLVEQQIKELEGGRRDCGCGDESRKAVVAAAVPVPVPVGALAGLGWLAALILFPLGAFLAWWFLPGTAPSPTACELLEDEAGNCAAWVSYLCANAGDTTCTPSWLASTDLDDCEVWRDYKGLTRRESCITYQAFYQKYRDQGICMDFVQPRLLSWECPLVTDTLLLTVRDTIIRNAPLNYERIPSSPVIPAIGAGCQTIGTTVMKSIGPLLIATDPLPGGPYRWEDALTACSDKGLRLPCIGEIDFLIERIYRDDPVRAYSMLAGSGPCNLVNPADVPEGRIEFWTATEATDGTAWSFYFDTGLKAIGRQSGTPKSARLPCLCVKKDPEQAGSALPACYGKQLDLGGE